MVLLVEALFAISALIFIITALTIAGMAVRAYGQTAQRAMVYLSLGQSIAAGGMAATLVGAFVTGFGNPRVLLLVNSVFFTIGFLLIMYSLVIYES